MFSVPLVFKATIAEILGMTGMTLAVINDNSSLALILGLATLILTRIFDIIDRRQQATLLQKKMELDERARIVRTQLQTVTLKQTVEENTDLTKVVLEKVTGLGKESEGR